MWYPQSGVPLRNIEERTTDPGYIMDEHYGK